PAHWSISSAKARCFASKNGRRRCAVRLMMALLEKIGTSGFGRGFIGQLLRHAARHNHPGGKSLHFLPAAADSILLSTRSCAAGLRADPATVHCRNRAHEAIRPVTLRRRQAKAIGLAFKRVLTLRFALLADCGLGCCDFRLYGVEVEARALLHRRKF